MYIKDTIPSHILKKKTNLLLFLIFKSKMGLTIFVLGKRIKYLTRIQKNCAIYCCRECKAT